MKITIIMLLCCVWLFLAYRAYSHGDMMLAGVFVAVGGALTAYRLRK